MTLFSYLVLDTLDDLLLVQLESLYDIELRLSRTWHGLAEAATSHSLRAIFQENLHAATTHINMLEQITKIMGLDFHRKPCETIECLISQVEETLDAAGNAEVKNAALIVVARRILHYKIAAYASLRHLVQRSGRQDLIPCFDRAVESEIAAEEKLTKIAEFPFSRDVACSAA